MDWNLILAFLGPVIAAISGIYVIRRENKKADASVMTELIESASKAAKEWQQIAEENEKQRDKYEQRFLANERQIRELKEDLEAALAENANLARQIVQLKIDVSGYVALKMNFEKLTQDFLELKRANEYLARAIVERDKIITEFRERFEKPLGGLA